MSSFHKLSIMLEFSKKIPYFRSESNIGRIWYDWFSLQANNTFTYKTRTTPAHAVASCMLSSFTLSLSRCDMTPPSLISSKRAARFLMLPNARSGSVLLLSDACYISYCVGALFPPSIWRWMAHIACALAWWRGIKRRKMCSVHCKHICGPEVPGLSHSPLDLGCLY